MPTTTSNGYRRLIGGAPLLQALLLLGGCAGMPEGDPKYASTPPPPPPPPPPVNGAIFQVGYGSPLFADLTAHQVGDVLTIRLVERTNASKKANTGAAKDSSVVVPNPTLFGKPVDFGGGWSLQTDMGSKQAFSGKGDSSQSNSLLGDISVTVAEVLSNGNLVVRGEKILVLNQGDEYIRLSGIVRPTDISSDNSVPSNRVADVRISYAGDGTLADANTMGWLSRFFLSMFWPF